MPPKYSKKTLHESILTRPDSYVGQTRPEAKEVWLPEGDMFTKKTVSVSPALLKVFDEILVNAIDQCSLSDKVTRIDIKVSQNGEIRISNNGTFVPVVVHRETNVWTPELIFGHLLTSSNYDDTEERVTGGRNGYGAKLTNIYSKWFTVEVNDPENKVTYFQKWENNMYVCNKHKITKYSGKQGSVEIAWVPDWERFEMSEMTTDVMAIFLKRALDAATWTSGKCKVYFNDILLSVKNFLEYANRFDALPKAHIKQDRWEVVVFSSNGSGFRQVSLVNGICTDKGGTHVDHVVNQITADIAKKTKLRQTQIKQCMFIFVKAVLVNPSFSSQSKQECTLRVQDFGSLFEATPSFLKQVKGVLDDELNAQAKASEIRDLKKSDGTKKNKLMGIPKLDDANWAGTSKSDKCTLIITEGDSAKALAISGLSVVGRDCYGVFPLKGKPRNVRDLGSKALASNQEFSDLKKILGLQQGKKYKSLKELRYARLMIMTDADVDGSHIKGLVLNIFDCYWPELIEMGFLVSMITPVIRVKHGSKVESFYTERDFLRAHPEGKVPRGHVVKYYKGLGTSTSQEAKEYFKELERLTVSFSMDEDGKKSVGLAFTKTMADARKGWLSKPFEGETIPYGKVQSITVSDFIHRDLIQFSHADIRRSIPDLRDGLKPSQRKVIYGCMKRNLTGEVKVAQLSGYISEHTSYHHGEMSLQGTIVGLAQDYMGSNNMNLLEPCGQFGTRLAGGSDHASARYIFTKLSKHAKVFDARDSPCLTYLTDDGKQIEPNYYIPTLPMVLVNGAEGIGTGFSCKVPPHNPEDIKENIKLYLSGKPMVPLRPWFRGFKGSVVSTTDGVWTLRGVFRRGKEMIEITEIPPGMWTQTYKEFLEELIERDVIRSFTNHSTEEDVRFVVNGYSGNDIEKDLRLTTTVRTTNMYLHGPDGIKKYETTLDILGVYIEERLELYAKRKAHLIEVLTRDSTIARTRSEFVNRVLDGTLKVMGVAKGVAEANMAEFFPKVDDSYDYLWNLKTSRYTRESVEELRRDADKLSDELGMVMSTGLKKMWLDDLV